MLSPGGPGRPFGAPFSATSGACLRTPFEMGERQRELFPLPFPYPTIPCHLNDNRLRAPGTPSLCTSTRRRLLRKWHRQAWCNEGVAVCNELSGFPFSDSPNFVSNDGQKNVLENFQSMYSRVPPPPSDITPARAFTELCRSATRYDPCGESGTAAYTKELVSWPPIGSVPADVTDSLEGADYNMVYDWEQHVLKNAAERVEHATSADRPRPFLEPTLVRRPAVYGDFLSRLDQAGMLCWREGGDSLLGVLFAKKNLGSCASF